MKKTSVRVVVAILLGTAAASTGLAGVGGTGGELLVIGPVESVNAADSTATILGQLVHTAAIDAIAVGNTVAVFGTARADGTIEASAIQSRGTYVPGATSIFVSGTVQRAEPALGRVVVSGVTVDLTSAMSYGVFSPAVGSKLAISGTQPVSRGLVLVSGSGAGHHRGRRRGHGRRRQRRRGHGRHRQRRRGQRHHRQRRRGQWHHRQRRRGQWHHR